MTWLSPSFIGFHDYIISLLSAVNANVACTCIGQGCPRWSQFSQGEGLTWPRVIKSNLRRHQADLLSFIPTALLSLQGLAVTFPKHFSVRACGDVPMLPLVKKNGKL